VCPCPRGCGRPITIERVLSGRCSLDVNCRGNPGATGLLGAPSDGLPLAVCTRKRPPARALSAVSRISNAKAQQPPRYLPKFKASTRREERLRTEDIPSIWGGSPVFEPLQPYPVSQTQDSRCDASQLPRTGNLVSHPLQHNRHFGLKVADGTACATASSRRRYSLSPHKSADTASMV
jgi:hypothetical protein